jgi:hypothetical protein
LSDAGLHQRQTKALYPNHRLPPWLTEDATRDRSNRLLGITSSRLAPTLQRMVDRHQHRIFDIRKGSLAPQSPADTLDGRRYPTEAQTILVPTQYEMIRSTLSVS